MLSVLYLLRSGLGVNPLGSCSGIALESFSQAAIPPASIHYLNGQLVGLYTRRFRERGGVPEVVEIAAEFMFFNDIFLNYYLTGCHKRVCLYKRLFVCVKRVGTSVFPNNCYR